MTRFVACLAAVVALACVGSVDARGDVTLDISYSGSNLGARGPVCSRPSQSETANTKVVSGYINAVIPGVSGTVYETIVPNANFGTSTGSPPGTSVFENSNGDEPTYDNLVSSLPLHHRMVGKFRTSVVLCFRPRAQAPKMFTCRPTLKVPSPVTFTSPVTVPTELWVTDHWTPSRSHSPRRNIFVHHCLRRGRLRGAFGLARKLRMASV